MPRIYVASLKDYNAGTLYGIWIDLDEVTDEFDIEEAIEDMLAGSPTAEKDGLEAEEWKINDYEGFYSINPCKLNGLEAIIETTKMLENHGEAWALFIDLIGEPLADVDEFIARYRGVWKNEREFAIQQADDTLLLSTLPDHVKRYFDYDQYTEDIFNETFDSMEGSEGTHVFEKA